jgi:hypothetical protein
MPETDRAEWWRSLAAEALDLAKVLTDPAAKQVMLAIVEKYVELAERAEERGGTGEPEPM